MFIKKLLHTIPLFTLSFILNATPNHSKGNNLKRENSSERQTSFKQKEKSISEKIDEHIQKRQEINHEILSIELEINLLRTRKNNMTTQDYQSKMLELSNKLKKLKVQPY
ncbi:TPA: hypothetical protein ACTADU_002715 [Salmonella enterica subsp. enterica serovar Warragul]